MARFYMVVAVAARMKPRGSKRISCDQMMLMGISSENRSLKISPSSQIAMSICRSNLHHPGSPRWPGLLVASGAVWLSGRFLTIAERNRRWPRCALALLWLSDQCGGLTRRMLTAR
jgi:hypothetical protein